MIGPLLEFSGLCRKNGMRVSTAEVLDAVAAAHAVGIEEVANLRGALEATLVKRPAEQEIFDELFDLYFFRPHAFASRAEGESPLVDRLRKDGLTEEELERLLATLADEAAKLSPLARMALGLNRGQIEALLRLSGLKVDLSRLVNPMQIGFFTQQLIETLDFRGAQRELARLRDRLAPAMGERRAAEIARLVDENLARLKGETRGFVQAEFNRRNVGYVEQFRRQQLADKPFSAMSAAELARLKDEVRRLAKKLKDMAALRRRIQRRGRLDARRTLRAALRSGGVPFQLKHRKRRIEKPRLVVLCDISDSVRHVSRFMLQLAYTLQDLFSKVRSFVFVSDLGECTALFREHDLDRAVELAHTGGVVNIFANSNFGQAFRLFCERHLDAVTKRTTVVVIGDGRNNYNPPEAWALAAIGERARRVLWLNPEPPMSWAFGDSAMSDYEPYCDRVEMVNSLSSLAKVVDSLVL
jgi:uncharacterized protein with von Willebrand factor type A (vWA) domain